MINTEKKILRYMDLGYYIIFVPIVLMLIPINRLASNDPWFLLLSSLYMVTIHFINRRFNIVTSIFNGKYTKATVVVGVIGGITILASNTDALHIYLKTGDEMPLETIKRIRTISLCLLCFIEMSFSVMLGLMLELFKQRIVKQEIEAEKNRAELALYKSQINPHFMFNTMNTLYGLFITKSDKTGDIFIKFTDIIKYMYLNTEREKITISEEVKYIREYIDLHTLRLGEHTKVNFNYEIDDYSAAIPPMIFITFVENSFKYGISSTRSSTIDINLTLKHNYLIFTTSNSIFRTNRESSGIGIANCRKRLELLYPERYSLESSSEDNIFKIALKIEL